MAESPDQLGLVQRVGGLLHPAHRGLRGARCVSARDGAIGTLGRTILVNMSTIMSLETSTVSSGASQRYEWNDSGCSLTGNWRGAGLVSKGVSRGGHLQPPTISSPASGRGPCGSEVAALVSSQRLDTRRGCAGKKERDAVSCYSHCVSACCRPRTASRAVWRADTARKEVARDMVRRIVVWAETALDARLLRDAFGAASNGAGGAERHKGQNKVIGRRKCQV